MTISDQTPSHTSVRAMAVATVRERATVRDLIRRCVSWEVRDHNASLALGRVGPVKPAPAERYLGGRVAYRRGYWLDRDAECAKALRAFESGQLSVLVDKRRATDPDAEIEIGPETAIAFVWGAPRVGPTSEPSGRAAAAP